MNERMCCYCLETYEGEETLSWCPACKMGACKQCGARLKPQILICFGCGTISPEIRARMVKTSSTGSVYADDSWRQDGMPRNQTHYFGVCSGWKTEASIDAGDAFGVWIERFESDGTHAFLRDVTEKERVALGYKKP